MWHGMLNSVPRTVLTMITAATVLCAWTCGFLAIRFDN